MFKRAAIFRISSAESGNMTKQQKRAAAKRKRTGQRRQRQRALPLPNAIAWTIPDYQALGGPGKTTIYTKGKTGSPYWCCDVDDTAL